IKERKLQWKKEEQEPSKQPETSGSRDSIDEKKGSNEELKHEMNNTLTVFENDDLHPAPVKEEKCKLQWAPGAVHESMSEPAVRKVRYCLLYLTPAKGAWPKIPESDGISGTE
ncbi:hypothetical protein DXG03_008847, partial [Asterophora parasitica]